MAQMIRYRSILDPDIMAEEPDTDEGRARLAERIAKAQEAHPGEPAYFMGRAEYFDPDEEAAKQAQEAGETEP